MLDRLKRTSAKTTTVGIIGGLILILPELKNILDSDPETVMNFNNIIIGVTAIVGFFFTRDNGKSSEDVGLKKGKK